MSDNWRIRIEPQESAHAESLLERLGFDLGSDEAKRLAHELEGHRLAVSRDDDLIFVYAETAGQADQARQIVEAELQDEGIQAGVQVERWLPEEERWSNEPPQESWEQEGYDVVRRWRYLIVGTSSEEEARELARRIHGEAEPGGEAVWEVAPRNPFAIFGGLGA